MSSHSAPTLMRDRHVKYWLRCAKTELPGLYLSNDSNRMMLAYLIVSALDLLEVLDSNITRVARDEWMEWIYSCQLPTGGFRGFSGTNLGNDMTSKDNAHWDPASMPGTFFALINLVILGDDLSRVRRRDCLQWLPKLQRDNGSFGEILGENGSIEGGNDLRFCECAVGIRYILKNSTQEETLDVEDFDIAKLISYIQSCQVAGPDTCLAPYG